jgi:hypothetical protein
MILAFGFLYRPVNLPDARTDAPDTDYFFLGDGRVMAVVQWSRSPLVSPFGLLICDPERMSRKHGSLLFHPEFGLSRTCLTVTVDGVRHTPRHNDLKVRWGERDTSTSVILCWHAGDVEVTEEFSIQRRTSNLLREVTLRTATPHALQVEAAIYANPLFFDEFGTGLDGSLYASGYARINFYSIPAGRPFERFLRVDLGETSDPVRHATFVYGLDAVGTHEFSLYPSDYLFPPVSTSNLPSAEEGRSVDDLSEASATDNDSSASLAARIMKIYAISATSLRAGVSRLGKFDASIWQYDFEWGMDAAMVATAAASSGQLDLSREVLTNILHRLSNPEGMIAEASRFRGGALSELNGNGAVLDALWHYWRWSGDTTLLKVHWNRIAAIANFPLRSEFSHPSGLLRTRRDFWERTPWMGVQEGFEIGHQVYCGVGLRRAAEIAQELGHPEEAQRWRSAGERMLDAMLHDPEFSLVEEGCFIRRRLIDGSVQRTICDDPSWNDPDYISYIPAGTPNLTERSWEPDVTEALPIVYGLVDPESDLAQRTLQRLDALWNPNGLGGYARYNIDSEPDSPGAWSFATMFMASAEVEAKLEERSRRTIEWLCDRAGAGGSWFEYYGPRQTPPFPPIGIVVWGWAQFLLLVVKHIVGIRVAGTRIRITPKLPGIEHTVRFGGHTIDIIVRGTGRAQLDGVDLALEGSTASIPLPLDRNHRLEFL